MTGQTWLVLDACGSDGTAKALDQLTHVLVNNSSSSSSSATNRKSNKGCLKCLVETSDLSDASPSLVATCLLVVQPELEWPSVLEAKLTTICSSHCVPRSRAGVVCEYSHRFFVELTQAIEHTALGDYKSLLHGDTRIRNMSVLNFVLAYATLFDCLLRKHGDELRALNDEAAASAVGGKFEQITNISFIHIFL